VLLLECRSSVERSIVTAGSDVALLIAHLMANVDIYKYPPSKLAMRGCRRRFHSHTDRLWLRFVGPSSAGSWCCRGPQALYQRHTTAARELTMSGDPSRGTGNGHGTGRGRLPHWKPPRSKSEMSSIRLFTNVAKGKALFGDRNRLCLQLPNDSTTLGCRR
jgi:hypothetical protein